MKPLRALRLRSPISKSVLLALAVFVFGFAAGNLTRSLLDGQRPAPPGKSDEALAPILEAASIIESRYIDPVEANTLVDGAIKGMVDALGDGHSGYLRPDLCPHSRNFSGEFTGIGVTSKTNEETGLIEVVTVIPGAPADAAGVRPGDIFHEVDGRSVSGLSHTELSALVPGARGTMVSIVFKRGAEFITFDIIRDTFRTPNVSYEIVGENIAHITMLDFHDLSRSQLDEALVAVDIANTSGLIFDIRNNPGGTLASAIEIASAFIEDGILLRQVARDQSEEVTRAQRRFRQYHRANRRSRRRV